jgi:hypothetical protein
MPQQQTQLEALTEDAIVLMGRPSAVAQKKVSALVFVSMVVGMLLGVGLAAVRLGPLPPRVWQLSLIVFAVLIPLMLLYMRWIMRLVQKRVESRKIPVTLRIDGQGVWVQDVFGIHGPVPWSVLGAMTPRHFMFPMVHFALTDIPAAKRALGSKFWYLWYPGGLGIRTDIFGMTAEELIERIERYRKQGLG